MSRRRLFPLMIFLMVLCAVPWCIDQAGAQYVPPPQLVPGVDYMKPNYGLSPILQKFVDTLPGLTSAGANNRGQYIPVATAMTTLPAGVPAGSAYYEIAVVEYKQQMHSNLPTTTLRGYVQIEPPGSTTIPAGSAHVALNYPNGTPILYNGVQVYAYDQPRYLGPVIAASKGTPTRIKFYNLLPLTANGGNLFIPTDTTIDGAGKGPNGQSYTQNRATLHLHGGDNPWVSDGTAHQWITPAGEGGSLLKGASQQNVPDMPAPGSGSATFYWPNGLSGRLMFYHDHAYGITRLNVYAGEAAGYLLTDSNERALNSLVAAEIPLVIQDKGFVNLNNPLPAGYTGDPNYNTLYSTNVIDPLWDTTAWGGNGNLWFPHVYMPNQNPNDLSGANPLGRWDYGPWFWPVFPVTSNLPLVSSVPEAFMDTPIINGQAYPQLNVNAGAYRFRILNACNDRYINLQFYVASPIISGITVTNPGSGYTVPPLVTITNAAGDTTGKGATAVANIDTNPANLTFGQILSISMTTVGSGYTLVPTVTITPAFDDLINGIVGGATATATLYNQLTEVGMLPADKTAFNWPSWWTANDTSGMTPNILDGRPGGVPDPFTMGPSFIHIGSEGGLSPTAVELKNTPIGYEQNKRSVTVLNTYEHTLFLGPAERADVMVDFSKFAGKTLIMYNDAPAPLPAGDPRNDYYTGDPDNTSQGGAPSTVAGFGPNTRTMMQIVVSTTPGPALTMATLKTQVAAAFTATQPAAIVPANTYAKISDTSMTLNGVPTPLQPKTIQELFDTSGKMNATLGVEIPFTTATIQTTIPYGFVDPATEVLKDGETQLWKITHNGVDTHAIHFHLFNVQVINRVGWDGQIKPPWPEEIGWKDTVKMNPLEDIVVALQAKAPTVPFKVPNNIRYLDVANPAGSTAGFLGVDPNNNPVTVTNIQANFGAEYTWHCHLLGHEENDMMRPMMVALTPEAPSGLAATILNGNQGIRLNWTNNALAYTGSAVQRAADAAFTTNLINFPGVGVGVTTYTDATAARNTTYYYRVLASNTVGSGVPGYPSATATSTPSNTAATLPAAPTNLRIATNGPNFVILAWTNNSTNNLGFYVERSVNGGAFVRVATTNPNTTSYRDSGLVAGNTYSYRVQAYNNGGVSVYSNTVSVTK